MIRVLAAVVSGLIFLIGCVVLVGAAAVAWVWVIAAASSQTHWSVGAALLVASFFAMHRYQDILVLPWNLWRSLWVWIDDEIEKRTR